MPQFANTQDLVPVEEIRQGTVILKGGKMLKVIMVSGINFAMKSEEEQNIVTYAYQNFLNSVDFPLQIVIHSRKINIDHYLKRVKARMEEEPSELLRNQIAEYAEFIRSFVAENPIMAKTFFVVVSFTPVSLPGKEKATSFFPIFGKKSKEAEAKAQEEAMKHFEHNLSQLDQRVSQATEGLTTIGLEAEALDNQALAELFYNFYNPETVEREDMAIASQPPIEKKLQ